MSLNDFKYPLTGSRFLERVAGKEGVTFFRGLQYLNKKINFINRVYKQNLNWEILTKNLVTFKRWNWVEDEKCEYYGDSLENLIFRGGLRKTNI